IDPLAGAPCARAAKSLRLRRRRLAAAGLRPCCRSARPSPATGFQPETAARRGRRLAACQIDAALRYARCLRPRAADRHGCCATGVAIHRMHDFSRSAALLMVAALACVAPGRAAAANTCQNYERLGPQLAMARDSNPAQGVE